MPAEQAWHELCPELGLYVPAEQEVHDICPELEKLPIGQSPQDDCPKFGLNLPAEQAWHELCPELGLHVPIGHIVQYSWLPTEYFPGVQATGVPLIHSHP